MNTVSVVAALLAFFLGILASYWWVRYVILDIAVRRTLSSLRDDRESGCLTPILIMTGPLTLLLVLFLEAGAFLGELR